MSDFSFANLTGLNNLEDIELGLGRLDVAKYGSNQLLPVGALEGTATINMTRTAVDVKSGLPQVVIKKIISEEGGDITAIEFHYHGIEDEAKAKTDSARYGEFLCDNTIRTTIGRLDR